MLWNALEAVCFAVGLVTNTMHHMDSGPLHCTAWPGIDTCTGTLTTTMTGVVTQQAASHVSWWGHKTQAPGQAIVSRKTYTSCASPLILAPTPRQTYVKPSMDIELISIPVPFMC
jgi:hypothetical protein